MNINKTLLWTNGCVCVCMCVFSCMFPQSAVFMLLFLMESDCIDSLFAVIFRSDVFCKWTSFYTVVPYFEHLIVLGDICVYNKLFPRCRYVPCIMYITWINTEDQTIKAGLMVFQMSAYRLLRISWTRTRTNKSNFEEIVLIKGYHPICN